jgi:hypothetical protein
MTAHPQSAASNTYQPVAPSVADKLHTAEVTLRRLEEGLPRAALDTALNKPGSAAALAQLRVRITDARSQQEDLALALLLARKQDMLADLAQWRRVTQMQMRAVRMHATLRLKAVADTGADPGTARTRYMASTAHLEAAVPIGCTLPRGALLPGSATALPTPDVVKQANAIVCDAIKAQLGELEQSRRAKIEMIGTEEGTK